MSATTSTSDRLGRFIWGYLILSVGKIWIDRKWPGSPAASWAFYATVSYFFAWFGSRTWMGYRRRRPYWTRESWHRYLRLAAWPIAALILLFAELSVFDNSVQGGVFGAPQSGLRTLWTVIDLTLMMCGALGVVALIEWMVRGEVSEQFHRTSWFSWRNVPSSRRN